MDAQELHRRTAELYVAGRFGELIDLAEGHWKAVAGEVDRHAAEAARSTMLAHYALEHWTLGDLWRVRAVRLAAQSGWWNGLALLVVSQVFSIMAKPAKSEDERYIASTRALDEMLPLIEVALDDPTLGRRFLLGMYYEKKGFLAFATGRYTEAEDAYRAAAQQVVGDFRRELKIEAAHALCRYLAGNDEAGRDEVVATTRSVRDSASGRFMHIAEIASTTCAR